MITFHNFQSRCAAWALRCFGMGVYADKMQRNFRFVEEAIELAQANDVTKADVLMLVDYVYGRPKGDPAQEIGGVMTTLSTLCEVYGHDLEVCAETELKRCEANIEKIRAKWIYKPHNSPLTGSV